MAEEYEERTLGEWQKEIHRNSKDKGFYDDFDPRNPKDLGMRLALIHSEVSEALEEVRMGFFLGVYRFEGSKPEGLAVELADVLIRVLDLSEALGIDLESMVHMKHAYNLSRPRMHGKKC